jgi:hypothetical protein
MKKNSERLLLKSSEATTIETTTYNAGKSSKQATPVSGRKVLNTGTIISKDTSSGDETKSGDVHSPFRGAAAKITYNNEGIKARNMERKRSFQVLVRSKSPLGRNFL